VTFSSTSNPALLGQHCFRYTRLLCLRYCALDTAQLRLTSLRATRVYYRDYNDLTLQFRAVGRRLIPALNSVNTGNEHQEPSTEDSSHHADPRAQLIARLGQMAAGTTTRYPSVTRYSCISSYFHPITIRGRGQGTDIEGSGIAVAVLAGLGGA